MPQLGLVQNSFSQGEIGPYMYGRADNDIYHHGGKTIENYFVLPQGGLYRRPGFSFVDTIDAAAGSDTIIQNFYVSDTEQYLLVFTDSSVAVYKDLSKQVTLSAPWAAADLQSLRMAQTGNTMFITHPDYYPQVLQHDPTANSWAISDCNFVNTPFYRFNTSQSLTPSGTTGNITLTLSGTADYWTTNHVGVYVRVNWSNDDTADPPSNTGVAKITGIQNGRVANATVISTLGSTSADAAWTETAWSLAHGYPRTVTFYESRTVFGGTRDAPGTIFLSKTGDFFNFDDSQTLDDYAFSETLGTDQVQIIRNLKPTLDQLGIFTTVGEHILTTSTGPVTPTNVEIQPQTTYGIANVPLIQVDYQLIFNTSNQKEIRAFEWQFYLSRFTTQCLTTVAHHLFQDGQYPVDVCYLRGYKDFQSNFVFIPRQDGQMAVLTIDFDKNVLAWSRFTTKGNFCRVAVVKTDHGNGVPIDTLYAVVERPGGHITLEALTEDDSILVDCYYTGTSTDGKKDWTGATALSGQTVQIVADGLVAPQTTVSDTGSFSIPKAAKSVYVGLGYDSTAETMPLVVMTGQQQHGRRIIKRRAIVLLQDTSTLSVDGYRVEFRQLGASLLDQPLPLFTGEQWVDIGGEDITFSPTLVLKATEPLPQQILTVTTEVFIGLPRGAQ